MKRLFIAIIIGIIAITVSSFELIYTTTSTNQLMHDIDKATTYYKFGDVKNASLLIEKSQKNWINRKSILDIFLYHDIVDEITVDLTTATIHLENNNRDFLVSCALIEEHLSTLANSEYPYLENIL